jgi:hypothetical protein
MMALGGDTEEQDERETKGLGREGSGETDVERETKGRDGQRLEA